MKSGITARSIALCFVIVLGVYLAIFYGIEYSNQRQGPWEVRFISDGLENASRFYDYPAIAERIRRLTATGRWTVTYLGSNQDLSVVGRELGIAPGNMARYDASPAGTRAAWAGHARATAAHFSAPASPIPSDSFYSHDGIGRIDPQEHNNRN